MLNPEETNRLIYVKYAQARTNALRLGANRRMNAHQRRRFHYWLRLSKKIWNSTIERALSKKVVGLMSRELVETLFIK